MTVGSGGKYDAECEALLFSNKAQCACVIVVGGAKGSGFSLSTIVPATIPMLVGVLRNVANELEADSRALEKR
jgi:hypothetical protein